MMETEVTAPPRRKQARGPSVPLRKAGEDITDATATEPNGDTAAETRQEPVDNTTTESGYRRPAE